MSQPRITEEQRGQLGDALHSIASIGAILDGVALKKKMRNDLESLLQRVCDCVQAALGVEGRGRCDGCDHAYPLDTHRYHPYIQGVRSGGDGNA